MLIWQNNEWINLRYTSESVGVLKYKERKIMENQFMSMPMVALRGMTVLPEMVIHFDVSRKRSIEAIQRAMQSREQKVFLVAQRELNIEEPGQKDVYEIGTVATIKQIAKMSKNVFRVLAVGEQRARLLQIEEQDPCLVGEVYLLEEQNVKDDLSDMPEAKNLQQIFFEYTLKNGKVPKDVIAQIADIKSFKSLIYQKCSDGLHEPSGDFGKR